MKTEQVAQL